MDEMRRFILESHFGNDFARAIFDALPMFEAVSINKDFLMREAGSPERFKEVKDAVLGLWNSENMNSQMNQKAGQRVLNLLYLMEIRQPGFTDRDKLHAIHDLYIHNMLDTKFLNAVNSDTTPEQAEQALSGAVQHQVQQQKAYPDLSDEEEGIWNRVKVYHEFPDGFRWVYAVDERGNIASHIPSSVTSKTMNHCGNSPRAGSDDQYWELRDSDGKAYLTIILNKDGELEESKSWGNQVNKYRRQIQPYVKWFLMDKVKGVGRRYDYGYSTHTNYGVKDFIGDDQEFIDYVTEFKPALLGNTEEKILFWKGAIEEGIVTVDMMKRLFVSDMRVDELFNDSKFSEYRKSSKFAYDKKGEMYSDSVFGSNRFEVLCAACGECPFTDDELKKYIGEGEIGLEEFVNYDIHLLTPEMQRAFVAYSSNNFGKIVDISREVASFNVSDELVEGLIDPFRNGESDSWRMLLGYLEESNPPEKVHKYAIEVLGDNTIVKNMFASYLRTDKTAMLETIFSILSRFPDICVCDEVKEQVDFVLQHLIYHENDSPVYRISGTKDILGGILSIGKERGESIIGKYRPEEIIQLVTPTEDDDASDAIALCDVGAKLLKEYGNAYECTKFPSSIVRLVYLMSVAKQGIAVSGIEDISGAVVSGIRKQVNAKKPSTEYDAYIIYTLGLAASPAICGMLNVGELSVFMSMAKQFGWYLTYENCTPEVMEYFVSDLKAVNEHPNKSIVDRLARYKVLDFINSNSEKIPAGEIGQLVLDTLYTRATVLGKVGSSGSECWDDIDEFSNMVETNDAKIPAEEWPKWAAKLGENHFISWYVICQKADYLYDDPISMACIIRYVTGHDIFCPDSELATPGKDDAEFDIHSILDNVSWRDRTRICKIIAARLSPMVEKGVLTIVPSLLKKLSRQGMINPRAYRIAMEHNLSTGTGQENGVGEIQASDVWRMIRSPMLPQLVCNTIVNAFAVYEKHEGGWGSEHQSMQKITSLLDKLAEKKSYYQVMRSVQALIDTGVIQRMIEMAAWISNAYNGMYSWETYEKNMLKKFGYVYDRRLSYWLQQSAQDIMDIAEHYQNEPVPEPAASKKKRKADNGKSA